jgi:CubicO group peptidase (beta-lactamase class C family)
MQRRALLRTIAAAPLALGSVNSWAARRTHGVSKHELEAFIEQGAAPWRRPGAPGGAVAVMQDGEVLFRRAWGLRDLEAQTPFTTDCQMHICSISKQFTTSLLFLLEEDGRVDLDADIREYLPNLPDFGARVLVRHLSSNTSGIRDHEVLPHIANGVADGSISLEYTRQMVQGQRSLMFEPGSRVSYSNTNFVLLGWLIMQIEGKPLTELFAKKIFEPLGMRNTRFLENTQPQPEGSVVGYVRGENGYRAPRVAVAEAGAGGVWSTLDDLLIWERNFLDNRLGRGDLFERMARPMALSDGQISWYAHGLGTGRIRGVFWQGHSGGLSGMQLNRAFLPDRRLSVVVMKNNPEGPDPERFCWDIAAHFVPEPPRLSAPRPLRIERWRDLAGVYQFGTGAHTIRIVAEQEGLAIDTLRSVTRLTHEHRAVARSEDGVFQLRDLGDGWIEVKLERDPWIKLQKVESVPAATADLQNYVGAYASDELDSTYTVTNGGSGLAVSVVGPLGHRAATPLVRIAKDVFVFGENVRRGGATLTFVREGQTARTLVVSAPRAESSTLAAAA